MSIRIWGGKGGEEEDGKFVDVYSVAVGMDGSVFAYDIATGYIQHFTSDGGWIRKWRVSQILYTCALGMGIYDGISLSVMKEMSKMRELSAFPPGVLPICGSYVGEECIYVFYAGGNVDIQMFRTDGTFIRKWTASIYSITGCAVDGGGHVYIVGMDNKMKVFDSYGTLVRQCILHNDTPRNYYGNVGLWVNKDGTVYSQARSTQHINCYQRDGVFIRSITHRSVCPSHWITATECGRIFISDIRTDSIEMFGTDGSYIGRWGRGVLKSPVGPKVIRGDLYVVDSGNHRIVSIRVSDMEPETPVVNASTKRRRILE